MSLRLISKARQPIGTTSKGVQVFAISGREPDEDENGGGNSGEDGTGSEGQEGQNDEGSGAGSGEAAPKTYSAEEYAALEARMKAADQNASKAQNRLKEIEDAKKDDLTKATEKVTELTTALQEKDNTIAELRFANAFALDNSVQWHDPSLVLSQVRQRPEVTVEEDGTIKGLQAALKALAKEKPFLVKSGGEDDGDGETSLPRTGSSTGTGGTRVKNKLDPKRLQQKYKI